VGVAVLLEGAVLVLTHRDLLAVLDGREGDVIDAVRRAYLLHAEGSATPPNPTTLSFPGRPRNHITAVPAFLGGRAPSAGVQWIASFPDNIDHGVARASAAIILNSTATGRPEALISGSLISARRAAASAALATSVLAAERDEAGITLVGCGVTNFETLRFLHIMREDLTEVTVHDVRPRRADTFAERAAWELPGLRVRVEPDRDAALAASTLVSLATTAVTPNLDTRRLRPGTLVLSTSLRDVLPEAVLAAVNIVDDPGLVCRADTSLAAASRLTGDRTFVTTTIGDLLRTGWPGSRDPRRTTLFSHVGLGILDLVVAELARGLAVRAGLGVHIDGFLPVPTEEGEAMGLATAGPR
jgi:ornithine cyclodeaminase